MTFHRAFIISGAFGNDEEDVDIDENTGDPVEDLAGDFFDQLLANTARRRREEQRQRSIFDKSTEDQLENRHRYPGESDALLCAVKVKVLV